jgi:hypothetical protein
MLMYQTCVIHYHKIKSCSQSRRRILNVALVGPTGLTPVVGCGKYKQLTRVMSPRSGMFTVGNVSLVNNII